MPNAEDSTPLGGRVAVVTGGHSGVGYYITEALAAQGMRVAMFGRRRAVLDRAAEALGGAVQGIVCDIRDPGSVRSAFVEVDKSLGTPDTLINNAAVFDIYKVAEATDEELQATVETNLLGVLYCIREAVPRMQAVHRGDIVNVSSESVMHPFPFLSVYAASKAGLETLSRGLKNELRPMGIRIGVLRSGRVEVPDRETSNWDPERTRAFFEEAEAGGYMAFAGAGINPRTTASAVVNMLSRPPEASIDLIELRSS